MVYWIAYLWPQMVFKRPPHFGCEIPRTLNKICPLSRLNWKQIYLCDSVLLQVQSFYPSKRWLFGPLPIVRHLLVCVLDVQFFSELWTIYQCNKLKPERTWLWLLRDYSSRLAPYNWVNDLCFSSSLSSNWILRILVQAFRSRKEINLIRRNYFFFLLMCFQMNF